MPKKEKRDSEMEELKEEENVPDAKTKMEIDSADASSSKEEEEDGEISEEEFRLEEIDVMDVATLKNAIAKVRDQVRKLEDDLGEEAYDEDAEDSEEEWEEIFAVPEHCVPIRRDVRAVPWEELGKEVQFDVIMMDPPWQLASAAPTRGVAIGYKQLPNKDIIDLPIPKIQTNGFLFMWVINARYAFALEMFEKWGYEVVDDITWVKTTVNRRLAKGHGFYLQHAKETCLVGKKGVDPPGMTGGIDSDILFAERRGQSQKPEEIYEMIERLVPNGKYLEIFARRNNLRNFWVSVGIEL